MSDDSSNDDSKATTNKVQHEGPVWQGQGLEYQ